MKKFLATTLSIAALTGMSHAAMLDGGNVHILIDGVVGQGVSTITFSGSSTTTGDDSIRQTGVGGWSQGDTFQPGGTGQLLSDPLIQDALFNLTGNAFITIGGVTNTITQIFLDEDAPDNADDLGFRFAIEQNYTGNSEVTFGGTGTIDLDISAFNVGTYFNTVDNVGDLARLGEVMVTVTASEVPVPGALPLMAAGMAGLGFAKRRRKA
ncbi:VPLPA-CTERM sorting domain-containing protein [Parvularcula maris]|uniref:VPLPA-CTERM sorting domain-containing protein n=1 Tax=Parvularcula maris TaxID=2965077 RepID=A0A9X2L7K3_9PROT|nr:VPLPA-CTERM sorting domain-containing protein [Parvularcula maris]MCQ8184391.1 VPLPA-CTERM sorting domain-containing protein [Parvularcula maris]